MNKITATIKEHLVFFSGFALILLTGIVVLFTSGKANSFILLNSYHVDWLNNFFINYTFVGNGIFAICLAAIYLLVARKKQEAALLFYSFLLSGILVQIVKHLFYSPRPKLFFGSTHAASFIKGIEFYSNNSFPSGHTTTAFAMAVVIILSSKNKWVQLPVLLAAMLVGYSRIYLGQHFLSDVLMGAVIGIVSGMLCVYIAQQYRFTGFKAKQFNLKIQSSVPLPGSI